MKKLYLMRHGETLFNVQHKIQGWCDSPLTENGKKQALNAKKYFCKNNIVFDHAYCSTSERTEDTLKIITDLPYCRKKSLKEMNYGLLEGEKEIKLTPKQAETYYLEYGGDSSNDVRDRMVKTLSQIMSQKDHDSVLVVGHGAACFNFLRAFQDPMEELKKGLGNGILYIYNYDGITFYLDKVVRQNEMEC